MLEQIRGPADLQRLSASQLAELADEIRSFLIHKVAATGGHLGPNLGGPGYGQGYDNGYDNGYRGGYDNRYQRCTMVESRTYFPDGTTQRDQVRACRDGDGHWYVAP